MTGKPRDAAFGLLIIGSVIVFSTNAFSQTRTRIKAPKVLLDILDKEDRDCVMQSGLDKSVTARPIQLARDRSRQILVRGSGLCLCGAQNCGFWIYRQRGSKYELLLKGAGSTKVGPARTSANGYRDIVSQSHASASETIIRTYRYDGSRYQLLTCFNRAYYDDNGNYKKTPTNRPCDETTPSKTAIKVPVNLLNRVFVPDGTGRLRKHFRGYNSQSAPALLREAVDEVRNVGPKRTP